jgi:hypothetical protein
MYRWGCPATRRRSGPSSSITGKRVPCCRPCVAPTWPVPLPESIWIEIDFSQMRLPLCEESVAVKAHGGIQSSTGFCNDRLTPSLFNIVGRCLVTMAHFERTTCTARRRAKCCSCPRPGDPDDMHYMIPIAQTERILVATVDDVRR